MAVFIWQGILLWNAAPDAIDGQELP